MLRRSPIKSSKRRQRALVKRVGRRTSDWQRVWRWLKPRLEKAGRTGCEFRFIPHECWGELFPCHSKKRRYCSEDDHYFIAIGCQQMARYLDEAMSHEEMEKTVLRAIHEAGGLITRERKAA